MPFFGVVAYIQGHTMKVRATVKYSEKHTRERGCEKTHDTVLRRDWLTNAGTRAGRANAVIVRVRSNKR